MWGFALVESALDNLIESLFQLNGTSFLILVPNLELNKKVFVSKAALRAQKREEDAKLLNRICRLAEVRNRIAHAGFTEDEDALSLDNARDFMTRINKDTESSDDPTCMPFSELDRYHREMNSLWDSVNRMAATCRPVGELEREQVETIEQEISEMSNVVMLFPLSGAEDGNED